MRSQRKVRPPARRAQSAIGPFLLALGFCFAAQTVSAQTGQVTPRATAKSDAVTADFVAARQKEASESKDLDDATRSKVLDFYKQAAESLKAADNFAKQMGESKGTAERAPQAAIDAKAEQKRLRESTQLSKATGYPKQPETRAVTSLEHEVVDGGRPWIRC